MSAPTRTAERLLPAYVLYGEAGSPAVAERLHVETISSRSQLHGWEIRPHRHDGLFQILHIVTGQAEAWIDGATHLLMGPCAVWVPALVAHGFRFQPGVVGHVVTVQERHVTGWLDLLLASRPAARSAWLVPQLLMLARQAPAAERLADALATLADEHAADRLHRAAALDVALQHLLITLARVQAEQPGVEDRSGPGGRRPAEGLRAVAHLTRYRALVESKFRQQPRVAELAAELGISPTQLNRVCQAVLGQSALDVLHARLVLEAQRQLAYTGLSVQRIGLELGFSDAGYFSRFFLRLCGLTPGQWRRQAASA